MRSNGSQSRVVLRDGLSPRRSGQCLLEALADPGHGCLMQQKVLELTGLHRRIVSEECFEAVRRQSLLKATRNCTRSGIIEAISSVAK